LTEKLKRLDTLTPTAIKDMSETIVPDYIKFMFIYCFNVPTLTSIQKMWKQPVTKRQTYQIEARNLYTMCLTSAMNANPLKAKQYTY